MMLMIYPHPDLRSALINGTTTLVFGYTKPRSDLVGGNPTQSERGFLGAKDWHEINVTITISTQHAN